MNLIWLRVAFCVQRRSRRLSDHALCLCSSSLMVKERVLRTYPRRGLVLERAAFAIILVITMRLLHRMCSVLELRCPTGCMASDITALACGHNQGLSRKTLVMLSM